MPKVYEMPRMSDTMEEGTLIKWNVKVGDKVKAGDEVADIETDKATMPMPVYDDGVVAKLVVQPGATLKVGQAILVLAVGNESVEDAANASGGSAAGSASAAQASADSPATAAAVATAEAESAAPTADANGGHVRVSPLARKIAEEKGLDLTRIKGSGPEGRIIKRDVTGSGAPGGTPGTPEPQSAQSPIPNPKSPIPPSAGTEVATRPATMPAPPAVIPGAPKLETRLIPVSNMRRTIARRLVESKTTIPHFTVTTSVNMDPLLTLRGTLNQQLDAQGVKLSVNDFIVRAAALALVRHPVVNSSWTENGIQQFGTVNLGIAVALPADKGGGLVVPVLKDTLNKGLRTISIETRALSEKARTKGLSVEDMADGTFTLSNLGMYGVDHFEAIINPPQAAILAVGAAIQKAVVRAGQLSVGTEMTCTLSADHRVVDGATASEYLQTLKQMLENPAVLLV